MIASLRPLVLCAVLLIACGETEEPPEVPPRQLTPATIQYPEDLWDAGVEGETLLRIFIADSGSVDTARVEETSGHAAFDSAALVGARALRFEPATRGGRAVSVWRLLPVQFHPDSAALPAS